MDPPPTGRKRLRHAFLAGVSVTAPSAITLAALGVVFNAVYDHLHAFSSEDPPGVATGDAPRSAADRHRIDIPPSDRGDD